jgi:hypothetical protein
MYRDHIMANRNINPTSNVVTFYAGTDICGGNNKNFAIGSYRYDNVNRFSTDTWIPKLVKIDAETTLTLYLGNPVIYNNPYTDRFVVVKLPDKTITGFDINRYVPSVERSDVNDSGVFFSTIDIFVMILLLVLLYIYYINH